MQKHEHFEELCALAVAGELPVEEHNELYSHMRVCGQCRSSARDFVDVLQQLPMEHAELTDQELVDLQEAAGTESFFKRARGEGIVFSKDALASVRPRRPSWSLLTNPVFAVSPVLAALGVFVVAALWFALPRKPAPLPHPETVVFPTKPDSAASADPSLAAELSKANRQIAAVTRERDSLANQLVAARQEKDTTNSQLGKDDELVSKLQQKIQEGEKSLTQANSSAEKAQNDRDQTIASLIEQQEQLRGLETDLRNARAAVEQERELNSAAHEVRELMGARKLHILDVYDAENDAGSPKSFGRVIYTEGKSLIFYAFDLDQKRRGRKVSFQAWGENGGKRGDPRNLGVFYIDDELQKRWVLKVNDPAKLKAIDTVFVTVESQKEAGKPSGTRFLQAYLGSQPNHP